MKKYKLEEISIIINIAAPSILTLFGIITLIFSILGNSSDHPPFWFIILWLIMMGFMWLQILRYPFEITLRDDNTIEFRAVVRKIIVIPNEIKSIKVTYPGFIKIKLVKKSFYLVNHFNGFHEFLTTVKSLNPDIVIKGC